MDAKQRGEGGRTSVPRRTLSPTVQSGAISFSGGEGEEGEGRATVEDRRRTEVGGNVRGVTREKDQEPRSTEGASERSGNFLKLRLLNLISRCAGASA